jgi:taurine transport system permease protein
MALSTSVDQGSGGVSVDLGSPLGGRSSGRALERLKGLLVVLAVIATFIGIWWLIAALANDPVLVPAPPAVATRFVQLVLGEDTDTSLWGDIWISTERVLTGWSISVFGGVIVGAVMGLSRPIRTFLDPLVEFWRPIPPLAFAPLLVVWFGIGEVSKDLVVIVGAFPVMIISTMAGIRGVEEEWVRAAQSLGASRFYVMRHVTLPAALPEVATAARIASGLSWGSLVAAEMIAANRGLGYMILEASDFVNMATIMVGIVVIGCLAFTMDRILRTLERRLIPWKGHARS